MKKTVWEIYGEASLEYNHDSDEIFIREDTRHSQGGRVTEIPLARDEAHELMIALGELKVLLDAEKIERTLGEVA